MPSASSVALYLQSGQVVLLSGRTTDTQNPSLHLRDGPFVRREVWMQEARKGPVSISLGKPGGDREGIMLIPGAVSAGVSLAPKRGIDLGDGGFARRNLPPIKGPEMHARAELMADEAQPGDAGIGGFRDRGRSGKRVPGRSRN